MIEGAEEFLLKPVKLADVKRLKELIMRGGEAEEGKTKKLSPKRILQNDIDSSPSSSSTSSSSSSHDVSSRALRRPGSPGTMHMKVGRTCAEAAQYPVTGGRFPAG